MVLSSDVVSEVGSVILEAGAVTAKLVCRVVALTFNIGKSLLVQ